MSVCSQGSEVSTLPQNGQTFGLLLKSSKIPTASKSSSDTGPMSTDAGRSETSPTGTTGQLPLFPVGHHASRQVLPGSAEAALMTDGSGRSLLESLSAFYHPGCWQRILLESLVLKTIWRSRNGLLAWKLKTMRFSHRLYIQLQHSVPTIGDIESSLLPTLTGNSYGTNQGGAAGRVGKVRPSLQTMAKLLPTLTVGGEGNPPEILIPHKGHFIRPSGKKAHLGLDQVARMLPTLRAADGLKGIRTPEGAMKERIRRKQGVDLPTAVGGTLDPVFCEWYMGFEDRWTDVE